MRIGSHDLLWVLGVVHLVAGWLGYWWFLEKRNRHTAVVSVEQMVAEILSLAGHLDELRGCSFLRWLSSHSNGTIEQSVVSPVDIQQQLKKWLGLFSGSDLYAEYCLILDEIGWLRDADEQTVLRCAGAVTERHLLQ